MAVPVKDEAERIADCLRALAWQRHIRSHEIVVLLNNCSDQTEAVVGEVLAELPVTIHKHVVIFPPKRANAGRARSEAMRLAARLAGPDGILLTTDADGRVPPDWIDANLAAIRSGAEVVAGRAVIDPSDLLLLPANVRADDAMECAYSERLDRMEVLLSPDPADPWPRHAEHSGASIAVTAAAYLRAGGVPSVPVGEDREFIASLRRVDARIRHAPDVQVTVSGRIEGRAAGGMADTIRRRIMRPDEWIDDRLEPATHRLHRLILREQYRMAWAGGGCARNVARQLGIPVRAVRVALSQQYFGTGWEMIEKSSPVLLRTGVRRAAVTRETCVADEILLRLAAERPYPVPAGATFDRSRHRPLFGSGEGNPTMMAELG